MRWLALGVGIAAVIASGCSEQPPTSYVPPTPPDLVEVGEWPPSGSLTWVGEGELLFLTSDNFIRRVAGISAAIRYLSWSPDGRRVAFSLITSATGPLAIHVLSAEGDLVRLTPEGAYDFAPTWSPDGSRIAFVSRTNTDGDVLYVMNADGTNRRRLTEGRPGDHGPPAWSPDGTRIAYALMDSTDAPVEPAVYTIKPDGTERVRLASPTYEESRPTWSPDGGRLAYRTNTRIAIVDAEGRAVQQLNPGTFVDELAWSGDGEHIAFSDTCPTDYYPYYCVSSVVKMIGITNGQLTPATVRYSRSPAWVP